MILIVANIMIIIGCLIILLSSIGFAKTKDIFCSIHLVIISNIYGLSFLLIGLGLQKISLISIIKLLVLVTLNIIITIIITQSILRRAMINNITPKAEIHKFNIK